MSIVLSSNDTTYIALGSNLSYRGQKGADTFLRALELIREFGCSVVSVSSWWTSQSWPDSTLPEFYNAVISIAPNNLSAQEIMRILLDIEIYFGRTREYVGQPRALDLDLIDYRGQIICRYWDRGVLICPHPRAHLRSFVLAPLSEIAPGWTHPVTGVAISVLLKKAIRAWPCIRGGSLDGFLDTTVTSDAQGSK